MRITSSGLLASLRDLLPAGMLALTQALWFSVPFAARYWGWHTRIAPIDGYAAIQNYAFWIALGHAAHYLWIATYFARGSQGWQGYSRYLGQTLIAVDSIWAIPIVLFGPRTGEGGRAAATSRPRARRRPPRVPLRCMVTSGEVRRGDGMRRILPLATVGASLAIGWIASGHEIQMNAWSR